MKRLDTNKKLSAIRSNRAISLLLSFALLISMMPQMLLFPVRSVESEQEQGSEPPSIEDQYKVNIGKYAVFAGYYPLPISDKPEEVSNLWGVDSQYLFTEDVASDFVVRIVDCYYNEALDLLWYKVEAAPGLILPDKLQQYPWVFQDNVKNPMGASLTIQENMEVPSISSEGEVAVTVSAFNLPEGASVSASKVTFNGEEIPNVFDIKIIVDGEEWQPIDHDTTVLLSIPVEGDIATVTHFVDYAPAIHDGLVFESVADADEEALKLFDSALDAYEEKYGTRDCIALEILDDVPIVDDVATFETSSFSYYNIDGEPINQTAVFVYCDDGTGTSLADKNAKPDENKHNLPVLRDDGVYDNGQYYITTEGTGQSGNAITIQAAWDDVTYTQFIFRRTNAKITVYREKVSTPGVKEVWNGIENTTMSQTGYSGQVDRYIAKHTFEIDLSDFEKVQGDKYHVTIVDGDKEAYFVIVIANIADSYEATLTDPNGRFENQTINYQFNNETQTLPNIETEGYKLVGWRAQEPIGNWETAKVYPVGTPLEKKFGNVTLIAQWSPLYKYQIVFEDGLDDADIEMPDDVTIGWQEVNSYTFTWNLIPSIDDDHYEFMGWSVSTGGTLSADTTALTVTGIPADTATVTLTAVWKHKDDKPYTVQHYYETLVSGEYELVETEVFYGIEGNDTTASPNNTIGFEDKPFEQKSISGDDTIVEIYYERITRKVTWMWYDDETSSNVTKTVSYKYGEEIVQADAPIRDGYSFDYWQGYTDKMTMPADNVTFTAIWKAKVFALYYVTGEGTYIPPAEKEYGGEVTVTDIIPTRTGYEFAGWNTKEDGSGTAYEAGDTITIDGDKVLYAQWTPISYNVSFNANGGSGTMGNMNFTYDVSQNLTANSFTRAGYTFVGWNTAADGSGQSYADGASVSNLTTEDGTTVTLYAQWLLNQHTITWDAGEGTFDDGSNQKTTTVDDGKMPNPPEIPKKAEDENYTYVFDGWDPEISVATGTVTYTAQYRAIPKSTSLTITVSGGVGSMFLFKISGGDLTDGKELVVAIAGGTSVTITGLQIGQTYTVTELSGWSWRYGAMASQTVTLDGITTIIFSATKDDPGWLGGEGSKDNEFTNP